SVVQEEIDRRIRRIRNLFKKLAK
ncbi:unnamed protein product, partial [Allacma fusca]